MGDCGTSVMAPVCPDPVGKPGNLELASTIDVSDRVYMVSLARMSSRLVAFSVDRESLTPRLQRYAYTSAGNDKKNVVAAAVAAAAAL